MDSILQKDSDSREWLAGVCQFSVDPEHPYYLNSGNLASLGRLLESYGHSRAIIVTDTNVHRSWNEALQRGLGEMPHEIIVLEAGESSKQMATLQQVYERMLAFEADRRTAVVGLGGGVVGDITGLAASTYMRGLSLYIVPSTLLAMVDSSIGGKNGIDLPQGKNLIGTFYLPQAVFTDLQLLSTLPEREWGNGLVETLKTAIIGDSELFALLENLDLDFLRHRPFVDSPNLKYHPIFDIVKRAVTVKSQIVVSDFRESGERFKLNLGHTLGHGLEAAGGYTALSHGEAVALGTLAALRIAKKQGILSEDIEPRVTAIFERWGIPTKIPNYLKWEDTSRAIKRDKKRQEKNLVLILPVSVGDVQVVTGLDESELREAFESLKV